MRLTLCTLFNMNYHFLNTYYYCVHFSNYIVLSFLCHMDTRARTSGTAEKHFVPTLGHMREPGRAKHCSTSL